MSEWKIFCKKSQVFWNIYLIENGGVIIYIIVQAKVTWAKMSQRKYKKNIKG